MKTFYFLLFSCVIALTSCKKEEIYGCTDKLAHNYFASANEDNGSCYYPTKAIIEVINIWDLDYNVSIAILQHGDTLYQSDVLYPGYNTSVPGLLASDLLTTPIIIEGFDVSDSITVIVNGAPTPCMSTIFPSINEYPIAWGGSLTPDYGIPGSTYSPRITLIIDWIE